jgi:hypothetical protein
MSEYPYRTRHVMPVERPKRPPFQMHEGHRCLVGVAAFVAVGGLAIHHGGVAGGIGAMLCGLLAGALALLAVLNWD